MDRDMPTLRPLSVLVLSLLGVAALPTSGALAGGGAAKPTITSVTSGTVRVGDTLTIRGRNFVPGKRRNSVAFRRSGHSVSVKAATATRTKLTVIVPAVLVDDLSVAGGVAKPTRFSIRVRARQLSPWYSQRKRSALIGPGTGGRGHGGANDGAPVPAHCAEQAAATAAGDTLDDVIYSLENGTSLDHLLDPLERAAEKKLCDGVAAGTVDDDPAPPDASGPGVDPDDDGSLDAANLSAEDSAG